MRLNKVIVTLSAILALTLGSFAADRKVAVMPHQAMVNVTGPTTSVDLEAFCNQSPCNITWYLVLSRSDVGSISTTTGGVTTFTAGAGAGTAFVHAMDGFGNTATVTITVQN